MMKRNILAVIVPALLVVGIANTVEVYNKDSNKVDLYGKTVDLHYFSKGSDENSHGGNSNITYARLGFKEEIRTGFDLTGHDQWEYNSQGNNSEGADAQTNNKTRLAFTGLKYADVGSFDYGRSYGVVYDALGYVGMLPESGGGTAYNDDFSIGCIGGVATYCNSNLFDLVDDLNFAVQYLSKDERDTACRSNGDGVGDSISHEYEGFGIVGAYGTADRTNLQEEPSFSKGKKAKQWAIDLKYGANDICLAVNYGETRNAAPITNKFVNTNGFTNRTQGVLLVTQHQFDFDLRPSVAYTKSRAKDVEDIGDVDLVSYFEMDAAYYFNKDMSTHTDYIINQIDSGNRLGAGSDDIVAVGIVYQF